ncbi:hypothetical protein BR93DRAFT_643633 [Coniochaeta sp. PMI_546]|nr:hypothetical protein BR93DRAFT_643633 [Coniochaeta sp. PMI_546]
MANPSWKMGRSHFPLCAEAFSVKPKWRMQERTQSLTAQLSWQTQGRIGPLCQWLLGLAFRIRWMPGGDWLVPLFPVLSPGPPCADLSFLVWVISWIDSRGIEPPPPPTLSEATAALGPN